MMDVVFYILTGSVVTLVVIHYGALWAWSHDEVLDEERNR